MMSQGEEEAVKNHYDALTNIINFKMEEKQKADENQKKQLRHFVYWSEKYPNLNDMKDCFVVCDAKRLVTFWHSVHNNLGVGNELLVYKAMDEEKTLPRKVKVVEVRESNNILRYGDYIILELVEGTFEECPTKPHCMLEVSDKYDKIGFDAKGHLMYDRGVIRKKYSDFQWIEGSTAGVKGQSGSGIYKNGCFAGIVACSSLQEASPGIMIVPASTMGYLVNHPLDEYFAPISNSPEMMDEL